MIFRGFRDFEYALWQKTKTWKGRKLTENLLYQHSVLYLPNNSKHTKTISKFYDSRKRVARFS